LKRVALCGSAFADAAAILDLEPVSERAELALVDLADPDAVAKAAHLDPSLPRIVLAAPGQDDLLRALGGGFAIAAAPSAAAIGPHVARLAPASPAGPSRTIVVTGVAGGCGRTLLVVELARRLATRDVVILDLTGSGGVARALRVSAPPWSELEALAQELTPEHVAVIAAERDGIRVVGGAGALPSVALVASALRGAARSMDVVIVDAPCVPDERTLAACELADRVLVLTPDAEACAVLDHVAIRDPWIVMSRSRLDRVGERAAFRSLPDDPGAVRSRADGAPVAGALGRAYDEVAEVLAVDTAS
jgi:hypothetical protein